MAQSQAPCYTCELFKIKHPQTKVAPIDQQVGSKHTQRDTELVSESSVMSACLQSEICSVIDKFVNNIEPNTGHGSQSRS